MRWSLQAGELLAAHLWAQHHSQDIPTKTKTPRAQPHRDSPLAAAAGRSRGAAAAAAATGRQTGWSGRASGAGWREGSCRTWSADPSGGSLRRTPRNPGRCPSLLQLRGREGERETRLTSRPGFAYSQKFTVELMASAGARSPGIQNKRHQPQGGRQLQPNQQVERNGPKYINNG